MTAREARTSCTTFRLSSVAATELRARRTRDGDRLRRREPGPLRARRRRNQLPIARSKSISFSSKPRNSTSMRWRMRADCVIAGIQEHIEEAGIHSGDSSCVLPAVRIYPDHVVTIRLYTRQLAQALSVRGLDERAVCHQGQSRVRARSKSTRVADSSFCFKGYWCSARAYCSAGHGRTQV